MTIEYQVGCPTCGTWIDLPDLEPCFVECPICLVPIESRDATQEELAAWALDGIAPDLPGRRRRPESVASWPNGPRGDNSE